MASLLSLRPSKSVEESQTQTRSKILNTPALPSSTGLLTSFGGLKKEESLSKSNSLTRQGLGITLKRSKIDVKNSTDNKVSDSKEDSRLEEKVTKSNDLKDSIKINSEVPNKHENEEKIDLKKVDILSIKKDEVKNTCENDIAVDKVETKHVSLVGDYSSSDENSE